MTRFRRRTATIAVATSAVLLASAGAASAQTLTLRDAHHDVWVTTDSGHSYQPAPARKGLDVTRATLSYPGKNVVLTQHFANLARTDDGDVYTLGFRTNTGLQRLVQVAAMKTNWPGTTWMNKPTNLNQPVTCDGLSEHINYALDTVRVSVPATCLNNPRSVRFTAIDLHVKSAGVMYADNPFTTTAKPRGWSLPVHRG